jgi:DNA-directed RNA polymerase subunit RPC12/RpoP
MTNQTIEYKCSHCEKDGSVDLDQLKGMPLRDKEGNVVQESKIELDDKPLLVQCEFCGYPCVVETT